MKTPAFLSAFFFIMMSNSGAATSVKIEVGFQVIDPNHSILQQFAGDSEVVIDHVNKLGFEVYGSKKLKRILEKKGAYFTLLKSGVGKRGEDYDSPEATIVHLNAIQKKYPQIVSLIEIGRSVEGRSLLFAKISAPSSTASSAGLMPMASRKEFKYVANMHGDEIVGRELMVKLIEDLAKNYGVDERITRLLNTVQIYIMPSMNPDGAAHVTRANANGVDLNRSFPDYTTDDHQNNSDHREPEIQAMMKFQAQHQFALSANFHGGAEVVNYPYDAIPDVFPLQNLVQNMSLDYARKVPYLWNSTDFEHGVTNGYAWYQVNGGMQDWSYHWYGDLQLTIELTKTKWPERSTVDQYYQDYRDSLLGYIEEIAKL